MDDYKENIEKIMTAIELWIEDLKINIECNKTYLEDLKLDKENEKWKKEEQIAQDEALEELNEMFDWIFQSENT